ncbi:probable carotenoid cleavage dioxygenase 4, chloroplastic [Brassica napus]|uniref:probable carotenoid cleavage dioxygenase 4, chloroplastic n=1 Tax=Brassica napus TaxID=3708 RepID=UPI00207A309A|nr:probable carotenoid cleavage dioxygenase 4, chloroplastic [Brassica napus]
MYSVSSSSFISTFSPKPSLHLRHSSSSRLLPRINSTVFEERSPISNPSENNVPPPSKYKKLYTRTNRNAVASPAKLRPETTLVTALFTTVEDVFNTFIDPPSRPSVDPKDVLSGNFAPVLDELPPTECEIIHGSLPPSLDGAYIRNGPSPQFLPRGPYHLFDGDGMLHAIRISNGAQVIPNVFSGFNGVTASVARGALTAFRVLAGLYNPVNGIGLANTSLAFFCNRLFALGESDLPYAVRLTNTGDIETIGRFDFDGKFLEMSMTAHPKTDPQTGDTFAFRYSPVPPFLTFFRFDSTGKKQRDVPVYSLTSPSFVHDFAITKRHAIFGEIQIVMRMNIMDLVLEGGSPVGADNRKTPRVGVIPRYAGDDSEMKWFEVPGFNIIHAINAWDENDGNTVVLIAPNVMSIEHTLERMDLFHALVEKVKIDLVTGIVTRHPISARNLDFAVINPAFLGRRSRYVYAAIGDPIPKISGVVNEAEEDDGYVVTYVHDEVAGESKFLVMDAKSPELEIVAAVRLPRRVPYGFHGLFVKESDINKALTKTKD